MVLAATHSRMYSLAVDVWSIGCLFLEMAKGTPPFRKPLATGGSELLYLYNVFALLGAPQCFSEGALGASWCAHWHGWTTNDTGGRAPSGDVYTGPNMMPKDLRDEVPMLPEPAVDLLARLLMLDPSRRITPAAALAHPFLVGNANAERWRQGDKPCVCS